MESVLSQGYPCFSVDTGLKMAGPGISLQDLIEKFQLPHDQLDKEISDEHLREVSRIIDNHEIVCSKLGLTCTMLEMTEASADVNKQELQRMEMLRRWKEKCTQKATYRKLIEVLLECSRADQAQEVCKLLAQSKCFWKCGHCVPQHHCYICHW